MDFQFLKENILRFNANSKRFLPNRMIPPYVDEILSFCFFGASPDDYFRYEFYKKSFHERRKFITY